MVPKLAKTQIIQLNESALRILSVREDFPQLTLANMYDPDKMPKELIDAHRENDKAVENIYTKSPFGSDEERLECLFRLYEQARNKAYA